MIKDLVVVGAGGLARELESLIQDINAQAKCYNFLGYIDNDPEMVGKPVGDSSIIGTDELLLKGNITVGVAIGNPALVAKIMNPIKNYPNLSFPNLVHPSAIWHPERTKLGVGNVFCAGNVFTVDIQLGSFNFVNLSCTIGHDTQIQDFCLINPGCFISGGIQIGSRVLLGTGAIVLQYKNIGSDAIVGAGAVVTKDVEVGTTVVGNPARKLERK